MPLDFARARPLLQACDLTKLFVEQLGWEPCRQKLTLRAGEQNFTLAAIAEKRGFVAWLCESKGSDLPDHTTRLKLDRALAQTSYEHLIVFATGEHAQQSWMWVRREPGRPLRPRTHDFQRSQPGDSLLQKLQHLYVSIEEEEAGLSVAQIAGRARAGFDVERVTKKFYDQFKKEHAAFLGFIEGIPLKEDAEWYASVMLNRMMFVYFIQRKGFLDGDPNYLRNRLARCQQEKGKDKFYSFYRYFLLRLFHEGFGKRRKERAADLETLLGNIPYLNGGMFDVHELEKPDRYGPDIQIADDAFEHIFDYFDQYDWVLDPERTVRKPGDREEINPDVLGYIFEKYINAIQPGEQKAKGAYYTKEDITEYISKNTILPFLFDAARKVCRIAFESPGSAAASAAAVVALDDGSSSAVVRDAGARHAAPEGGRAPHPTVWDLLRENPDRYIYPAVRHGVDKPLPPEIATGVKDVSRRTGWNKPAPGEFALPTEIWREVVARRTRYAEIRKKLTAGEVHDINDLITLNLDIRQFAQDVIENCEGPELLRAFWHAIEKITILDPTGGSGAFLFAALNILEPLYEACLDRMEAFVEDLDRSSEKHRPEKFSDFRKILERVAAHPNRRYFIFKSIILNNLFGVDIMPEAIEICKLRLFLKLAAQVEPDASKDNLGIEPLPDIDFNIRAGNTLVGYATAGEVRRCMKELGGGQMKLMNEDELGSFARFNTRCADVEDAFRKFRSYQLAGDSSVPPEHKAELRRRLQALDKELNEHLARDYGVKVSDKAAYAKWLKSYQPCHWFVEFYGIVNGGGFDVIIGNPPYLDLKQLTGYVPKGYRTLPTKNLCSLVLERCEELIRSRQGYIVPISSTATEGYQELQEILRQRALWFASFDDRPAHLFEGLDKNTLSILLLGERSAKALLLSSRLNRWSAEERPFLFPTLGLHETPSCRLPGCLPRIGGQTEASIWAKLFARPEPLASALSDYGKGTVFYSRKVNAFLQVLDFVPEVRDGRGKRRPPSEFKELNFPETAHAAGVFCLLNSTLFRWFMDVVSDGSHLNRREVDNFPFDPRKASAFSAEFAALAEKLSGDLRRHSFQRTMSYSHDTLTVQCIIPKFSKSILDEIDRVLARHYGFTAEELDFIINYDIKYRLGRDADAGETD